MPDASHFQHLLGALVALLVATKLLGELAQRVGQPAVLGELLAACSSAARCSASSTRRTPCCTR
jgi:Kef-type K+ transport system membrane component KefB